MKTYAYGYPRLGRDREFKRAVEGFWRNRISEAELRDALHELQTAMLAAYRGAVELYPVGEVTAYDHMLDTAVMAGVHAPAGIDA